MSESEEHPQLGSSSNVGPVRASTQLWAYLSRLRKHGFVDADFDVKAAAAMLIGAVFADAMGRDVMPDIFPPAPAAGVYSSFLLRAIGVPEQAVSQQSALFKSRSRHK
jgi:hypothetical protein